MSALTCPGTVWARDPAVLWRRSLDRAVLKVPGEGGIIALDRAGLELWEQLEHPTALSVLADRIAGRYDAVSAEVARDLTPVLEDLERRRAVRRCA